MAIDVYKEWLGIPESVPRPPDHYQLLRLGQFEDDTEKVRGHYKKLNAHVRKYATGQYSVQSQELLNELAKAMLCLTDADRKRDYDESLGREFEPETDVFGRQPLLETLIQQGQLSRDQKREIEQFASARGLSERDAVVQMKLVEPDVAAQALARQLGYSYVDLQEMLPEDEALDRVPRSLVKKHTFIPLFIDDGRILIACAGEPEPELEEELRLRYDVPIRPVIATPRAVNQAIAQYYAPGMRDEAAVQEAMMSDGRAATAEKSKTKQQKRARQPDRRSFDDLTEEEQSRRKQMGILLICWSIILPMLPALLGTFWARMQMIKADYAIVGYIPWLVLLTAPPTIWWVTQKYWK